MDGADMRVHDTGWSVVMVAPLTDAGRAWVADNVEIEPWHWLGGGFGVERRFVGALLAGAEADGLTVEV